MQLPGLEEILYFDPITISESDGYQGFSFDATPNVLGGESPSHTNESDPDILNSPLDAARPIYILRLGR